MLLELLAVLQAVDPTAFPLWGVLVLAAGMYPLGMMLGSPCSPCCSPCGCPVGEQLPDALVVSFSGLTKAATKVENLLTLQLSSCFGGGAAGTVEAPGGLPGSGGPISAVTLTSGGSGYAVLGRVEPTGLSISATGGTGAEFSLSLTASADDCSLPYWSISSVTVTKAGEGYADNQTLSVNLGVDEFEAVQALLTLRTTPSEPTISATVTETAGVGLELSVTQTQVASSPDRWGVSKVSVTAGGSGYLDQEPVAFSVSAGETTESAAAAIVRVARVQPTVVAHYYGAGTGAAFSPTLTKTTVGGNDVWEVTAVTVTSGGSGYADNQNVIFWSDTVGEYNDVDSYWKIVTDGSGVVTSLTKTSGGQFWASSGVVDRVEVSAAGSYYVGSTNAASVTVNDGGRYYKERADIPAHVASVTASVLQTAPSAGAGAAFSVTVDDNPASATFGQVTAISPTAGGSGYLKWSYTVNDECCFTKWNGFTVLAQKSLADQCEYVACCSFGSVVVRYNGPTVKPTARIISSCGMQFDPTTALPLACENLSFSAVDVFGTGTMTVSPAEPGAIAKDYPCPACCSNSQYCTQEQCVDSGALWRDPCICTPSNSCKTCEGFVGVAVGISLLAERYSPWTIEADPWLPGPYTAAKEYDFTLTADNDWTHVVSPSEDGYANGRLCWTLSNHGMLATLSDQCTLVIPYACTDEAAACFFGPNDGNYSGVDIALCSGQALIDLILLDRNSSGAYCPVDGGYSARAYSLGAPFALPNWHRITMEVTVAVIIS